MGRSGMFLSQEICIHFASSPFAADSSSASVSAKPSRCLPDVGVLAFRLLYTRLDAPDAIVMADLHENLIAGAGKAGFPLRVQAAFRHISGDSNLKFMGIPLLFFNASGLPVKNDCIHMDYSIRFFHLQQYTLTARVCIGGRLPFPDAEFSLDTAAP